jgi:hypothetical protein
MDKSKKRHIKTVRRNTAKRIGHNLMNIRKVLFHKYFLIIFPIFMVDIIGFYFFIKVDNIYDKPFNGVYYDLWKGMAIVFFIFNFFVNPFYQLIINIIYNIKEWNENFIKNFVLMAFSAFLPLAIIFILTFFNGDYHLDEDYVPLRKFFVFLASIVLLIIIILGVIERFILEKIFDKINIEKKGKKIGVF